MASRILWLSPPESVPEERDSVRYPSPTLLRNSSLLRISFTIWAAMSSSLGVICRPFRNSPASLTERSVSSAMFLPPTVTASAVFFSLCPPQVGQGVSDMQLSISARIPGLWVSR